MNKLLKFSKIASIIFLILCLIRLVNQFTYFYKLPYILEIIANITLISFSFSLNKITKSKPLKISSISMAIGGCLGLISQLRFISAVWIWLDEHHVSIMIYIISALYFAALCFAFYMFHKCFKNKRTITNTALFISILITFRFILLFVRVPYDIIYWTVSILMFTQYLLFSWFFYSINKLNENRQKQVQRHGKHLTNQ